MRIKAKLLPFIVLGWFCYGEESFFSAPEDVKINVSDDEMSGEHVKFKTIKKYKKGQKKEKSHKKYAFNKKRKFFKKKNQRVKEMPNYVINVQEFVSAKNIKIRFVQKTDTEIVNLRAVFEKRGGCYENVNGLSELLMTTISLSDTEKYTAEEIESLSQTKGIRLRLFSHDNSLSLALQYVSINEKDMVDVLRSRLYQSKLNMINLAKSQLIDHYNFHLQNPEYRLSKKISKTMFGDHPLGQEITSKDYQDIREDNVLGCYKNAFSKENLKVVVVGNFKSEDDVKALVDSVFGDLPEHLDTPLFKKEVPSVTPKKYETIEENQPGYRNNKIFYSVNSAPEFKPDNFAEAISARLAVTAFAGIPLESRLINDLRKKLGKVYYARFRIEHHDFTDFFSGSTESSDYLNTRQAIENSIKDYQESGITEEEFNDAKKYILSIHVFDIVDGAGVSAQVMHMWQKGFDKDFVNTYYDKIKETKIEDVQSAIKKFFSVENLSFGVVKKDEAVSAH